MSNPWAIWQNLLPVVKSIQNQASLIVGKTNKLVAIVDTYMYIYTAFGLALGLCTVV